jgi:adenylosuccinate synthase
MVANTPKYIAKMQDTGHNILIEGTQGSALSLLHSYWPYCTSIDTNAAGIISEVGIAPSRVTDVLMICRTYPIRVAGNSGPMQNEITWEELSKRRGKNVIPEKTTVTKKTRRIAEWDDALFEQSCVLNAPTSLAITFADYVDPSLYGCKDAKTVKNSIRLTEFLHKHLPEMSNMIKYIGTGPETVIDMEER